MLRLVAAGTSSVFTWLAGSSCRTCKKRTYRRLQKVTIVWTHSCDSISTRTFPTASLSCRTQKPPVRLKLPSKAGDGNTANRSSTKENSVGGLVRVEQILNSGGFSSAFLESVVKQPTPWQSSW